MRIRQRFDYLITLLLLLSLLADPVLTPPLLAQNGASPTPPAAQTQFTLAPSVVQEGAATGAGTPAGHFICPLSSKRQIRLTPRLLFHPPLLSAPSTRLPLAPKRWTGEPGGQSADILKGTGPGNFGWLTWTGNTEVYALAASLTPPGNSSPIPIHTPPLTTPSRVAIGLSAGQAWQMTRRPARTGSAEDDRHYGSGMGSGDQDHWPDTLPGERLCPGAPPTLPITYQ